jgi:hypothetical protein
MNLCFHQQTYDTRYTGHNGLNFGVRHPPVTSFPFCPNLSFWSDCFPVPRFGISKSSKWHQQVNTMDCSPLKVSRRSLEPHLLEARPCRSRRLLVYPTRSPSPNPSGVPPEVLKLLLMKRLHMWNPPQHHRLVEDGERMPLRRRMPQPLPPQPPVPMTLPVRPLPQVRCNTINCCSFKARFC